jgi:hypothetical protein
VRYTAPGSNSGRRRELPARFRRPRA